MILCVWGHRKTFFSFFWFFFLFCLIFIKQTTCVSHTSMIFILFFPIWFALCLQQYNFGVCLNKVYSILTKIKFANIAHIYIHFKIFLQIGTKTLIHIQNLQLQCYRFTKKILTSNRIINDKKKIHDAHNSNGMFVLVLTHQLFLQVWSKFAQ